MVDDGMVTGSITLHDGRRSPVARPYQGDNFSVGVDNPPVASTHPKRSSHYTASALGVPATTRGWPGAASSAQTSRIAAANAASGSAQSVTTGLRSTSHSCRCQIVGQRGHAAR